MNPRRITMVTTSLARGGAQVQLVHLATRLQARGWRVGIVSLLRPDAFKGRLLRAGIEVASLGMRRGHADPAALGRLAAILRRQRPSVIHSHMVHANLLARLARPLVRVPLLVSTAHSTNEGGPLLELAYRLTDPLCDLTTNVSGAAVERYARARLAPRAKLLLVPNGIDLAAFERDEAAGRRVRHELRLGRGFVWLSVGALEPVKDHRTLLAAFARTADPGARLLIAGEGGQRPELEALARHLRVADRVKFLGVRTDVAALLSAADAFVLPSAREGLPMVLLEAGAARLPVVATAVGGNHEVVLHEETGYLVPARDPAALAAGMDRLAVLPRERLEAMGAAARALVAARYDLDRVVDTWEGIYRAALHRRAWRFAPGAPARGPGGLA